MNACSRLEARLGFGIRVLLWSLIAVMNLDRLSLPANAQQNLFNIPSGQITPEGGFFFQQQLNVDGSKKFAAKSHFVFGLGGGWEVGVNAVNFYFQADGDRQYVNFDYEKERYPLNPLLLGTAQKALKLRNDLSVNFGTQYGANLSRNLNEKRNTHFTYSLINFHPTPGASLIAGGYLSDKNFLGDGRNYGILLGYEFPIIEDRLFAMGDFISGHHSQGNSVIGLMYRVEKGFEFCVGALIPNPGNEERLALVLELNIYNF